MNELFDRLLIRILLVSVVLAVMMIYNLGHYVLYPSVKSQVKKRLNPAENPADTLHLFSRLTGFVIVLSSLRFDESHGVLLSLFHILVWGTLTSALYLVSLFLIESIVLYNFDYKDEILKRRNLTYALICTAHALAIAHVTRVVVAQSESSLIILFLLWLLAMVIMGFGSKYYQLLSKLPFNSLVTNQNPSVAVSYLGFTLGLGWLVGESFDQEHFDITVYCIQVMLKILLSLIIYPLFRKGLRYLFKADKVDHTQHLEGHNWGTGTYECTLFLTSAILTSMIVNHIQFGTIYPFF